MSRQDRSHPNVSRLTNSELAAYLRREATYLHDQKQTAVPRALNEAARRIEAQNTAPYPLPAPQPVRESFVIAHLLSFFRR